MSALRFWLRPLLVPAGGVLLFVGERLLGGSPARFWLSGLGVLALAGAVAWAIAMRARQPRGGQGGRVWCWMALPPTLFLLAAGLYFAQQALTGRVPGMVDWAALAGWGWVLALLFGAVGWVFAELALLAQPPRPDNRRVRFAARTALRLGLVLALVVTLGFVFDRLGWQWDAAYFKTTEPSQATREVVQGLSEPVQVGLFFPPDSAVGALVGDYFRALTAGSTAINLQVHRYDADLAPAEARAFQVRGNGSLVLRKGDVRQTVVLGDTLERARGRLRRLDELVLTRLLALSRPERTVYYTVGHGERLERTRPPRPRGQDFNTFRRLLHARNYALKPLGLSEGLGSAIPSDAALVVIAGATRPFLAPEVEALRAYLNGGGRLLAYLEPGKQAQGPAGSGLPGSLPIARLLADYGVTFVPIVQANDRIYGRRTFTQADHALLVTVRYLAHPSVSALRVQAGQFPSLFLGAGALEPGKAPAGETVTGTVQAMPGTWADANGNFRFDPGSERRDDPLLAMAVAPRDATPHNPFNRKAAVRDKPGSGPTILVFADADVASDLLLQNRANQLLLEQGLAWVAGEPPPPSLPSSEKDVRIRHAKGDDWLWFYLPVFGVPALVLLAGFAVLRRRRRGGSHD